MMISILRAYPSLAATTRHRKVPEATFERMGRAGAGLNSRAGPMAQGNRRRTRAATLVWPRGDQETITNRRAAFVSAGMTLNPAPLILMRRDLPRETPRTKLV
jgi:hypothetical protein